MTKYYYLLGIVALLYTAAFATTTPKADLVLTNGNIITLAAKGNRAQAIAIAGGKIIATGTDHDMAAYIGKNTNQIDLHNKTVIPGFNDVHQHPAPLYRFDKPYAVLKLDTVTSMKNLITLLKHKAAITPKGMLIKGVGYNETKLGGLPIRDSLDKASTEHPIIITHVSGHLSAANSFLMNLNGIDENTKDPAGGTFERYLHTRKPDGICKEAAAGYLRRSKNIQYPPNPTPQEEMEGYRKYFNAVLASGVTSIGDAWTTPEKVSVYHKLANEHFPMRFNLLMGTPYANDLISGKIHRVNTDYLRIEGVKVVHGNSLSGKTCWLYEPYDSVNVATGKKDYYGIPPARTQASLDSLFLRIHKAGLQIACHSNGDREIDMVISAIAKAQKAYPRKDARHRIEHCSITNQDILNKIKANDIVPVFHCYMYELGDKMEVYGQKRIAMLHPTKTAMDMGIVYALHSDAPISPYPAMIRLGSTVNRKTKDGGKVIGANQCIGAEDAIKAYTYGGAYATLEENKKGRLVKGQFADMVVLDKDPTINPNDICNIKVLTTIVGGKVAYKK